MPTPPWAVPKPGVDLQPLSNFDTVIAHLNDVVTQLVKVYEKDVKTVRLENDALKSQLTKPSTDEQAKSAIDDVQLQINERASIPSSYGRESMRSAIDVCHLQTQITEQTDLGELKHYTSNRFFRIKGTWVTDAGFDNMKLFEIIRAARVGYSGRGRAQRRSRVISILNKGVPLRELDDRARCRCPSIVISPESTRRAIWLLICLIALFYDLIVFPIDACFQMEPTQFSDTVEVTSAAIWTLDMTLSFLTGFRTHTDLIMDPKIIAKNYIRSWFAFDLILLVPDWVSIIMNITQGDDEGADGIGILRLLRLRRFLKLSRIGRMLRLAKMKMVIRRAAVAFNLSKVYVSLTQGSLGMTLSLIVACHLVSCAWYAIGNALDDGWVSFNELKSAKVSHAYTISLHWTVCRLRGLMSKKNLDTDLEMLLDAFIIYCSLIMAAMYTGALAASFMATRTSSARYLFNHSFAFSKRHELSWALKMKMVRSLESMTSGGARQSLSDDQNLLKALPITLRHDLLFEIRVHNLLTKVIFRDAFWANPRVVRQLCIETMSEVVFLDEEILFVHGDVCERMLFVVSGRMRYLRDSRPELNEVELQEAHRSPTMKTAGRTRLFDVGEELELGASVSEAVLWTNWQHVWRLVSDDESAACSLDPTTYTNIISNDEVLQTHAARYARVFVRRLNATTDEIDDLTSYDLSIEDLDTEFFDGATEHHFMFLSHFKLEAGTEATLIRDLLTQQLKKDPSHLANDLRAPIFIDSEDLVDLAGLQHHVKMTANFILLLTPGVLSRPWCLVEIVTAVQNRLTIVPVEIQRPGPRYPYPGQEFYDDLLSGKLLPQQSVDLLKSLGITLKDCEKAIREVFLKIASPFSPHKTQAVREAELNDILKRCV